MKTRLFVFCWAVVCFSPDPFASLTPAEVYARVCVTTLDADSTEAALTENSSPSGGRKLIVHLDANTECAALIVPLAQKDLRMANGWRPQMVLLPQWTEKTLPASPSSWDWNEAGDPFELWVFFFKRDAIGLEEMQKLVTAMRDSTVNGRVFVQQTRRLCEMLRSRMSAREPIRQGPKPRAAFIGGTTRSADFPWRDYAQRVPLNDALEGELVVRHGR
jgi:hypothetical protein